jgi:hypothetical protein
MMASLKFWSKEHAASGSVLKDLADGGDAKLFADNANLMTEKFHLIFRKALLEIDALAVRLDEICFTLSGTIL